MRRRWRVTKAGWVILAILAVCAVLVTFAGGLVRFLAAALGGLILLMLVGEGLSGGWGSLEAEQDRKGEVLRNERFGRVDDR